MGTFNKLKVGFYSPSSLKGHKTLESYLEANYIPNFRILRMLSEAMRFDFEVIPYNTIGKLLPNGSWTGVIGMINRSEADMTIDTLLINDERKEAMHFSYPFRFYPATFIFQKPEFSPQVFGLVKTFSLSTWLIFALLAIVISIATFVLMKRRYSLEDVIFAIIFVICLNKSMMLKPWTTSQTVLVLNWMIGTMFLIFCFQSLLLAFLTFPPVLEIKDMQSLANAVENYGYNCMYDSYLISGPTLLSKSQLEPHRTVGRNLLTNSNGVGKFEDFFRLKDEKIAYFNLVELIPFLPNSYFVSDDYVLAVMAGVGVQKDFCCQKRLDEIVHKVVSSGLYAKVKEDRMFLTGLKFRFESAKSSSERRLMLSDFYLAFIVLLFGYALSLLVLIAERKLSSKKSATKPMKRNLH